MKLIFDLGGTTTRIALTADGRQFREVVRFATDSSLDGLDAFIGQLKQVAGKHRLTAVAGGLPGHTDRSGQLQQVPNLAGWAGQPVQQRLAAALGVPVYLENDTAVVGLGEAVHGAGRDYDSVVYITVSTGVNGAWLSGGRIVPSVTGFELGSMLLPGETGQLVSLESLTGGNALQRRYGRPPRELHDPAIWRQEACWLALALHTTLLHWSSQVVVYGGSMMRDIPLAAIEQELAELPRVFDHQPDMRLAELGDEGGLYGALALLAAQS